MINIVITKTKSLFHDIFYLSLFLVVGLGNVILRLFREVFRKVRFKGTVVTQNKFKTVSKTKASKAKTKYHLIESIGIFMLGSVFSLVFIFIPIQVYFWYRDLPNPELLVSRVRNSNTTILDRYGRLLYKLNEDSSYENVHFTQIPDYVIKSTLAIEDHEFYNHYGFRPLSIIRAARANIVYDQIQGGSTITQQLVKNILLSPEKTYSRKLKEVVVSVLVEKRYTKDQILEMYLNNISYGGSSIGIQAASKSFFGKNVWDLSLAEATMLAGLPSAPSVYSPTTGDFDKAKQRQLYVLERMVSLGYINREQADEAIKDELVFITPSSYIRAPHFVNYVLDLVNEKYGSVYVASGGLTIRTSIDLDLQEQVQSIVRSGVEKSKYLNITNGAALVLDKNRNEILAYVGSYNYSVPGWGNYDIIRAKRQPGSSIKPITYALALSKGMTAESKILDDELVIKNDWETYKPVNYDGKYHGEVTLTSALANSYNIPAVKLTQKYGAYHVVNLGKIMGLSSWNPDEVDYGVSVTLGGKEVTMLELANVYATFARQGYFSDIDPIISITDNNGYEIYSNDEDIVSVGEQVLDKNIAQTITNILSSNTARTPAFGSRSSLVVTGHTVSVKTGTTDKKRDNWTLGYDENYVVSVWVGNNNNIPMNQNLASGLSGAAPIWNQIFNALYK